MTLPGLTTSKPCGLDLTLAGSQVTFAQPIKYASGPSLLLNEGHNHFAKLTSPNSSTTSALTFEVRSQGPPQSGRRFGQLPPFPSKPRIGPCNEAKQIADICHRLACKAFGASPISDAISTLRENSTVLDRTNSAKLSVLSGHSTRQLRPHSLPSSEKLIIKTLTTSVLSSKTVENDTPKNNVTKETVLGDLEVSPAEMLMRISSAENRGNTDCTPPFSGIQSKGKERKRRKRSLKSTGKQRRPSSHKIKQALKLPPELNKETMGGSVPLLQGQCATIRVANALPKLIRNKVHDTSGGELLDSVANIRKTVAVMRTVDPNNKKTEVIRLTKVFLSDKQSGMLKELGLEVPCAPPATPMPVLQEQYEYIASLNDIRSQRALKTQLDLMEKEVKQKEKMEHEENAKQEKQNMKEKEKIKRKRQRLEIYALNKKMTDLEHSNFQQFCAENGIQCKL
ncbi:hypothetical protein CAPTEDRAFT_221287 [Capitella teleta]|uniref:Small vasohibin-binding protein n=1 Tax=Capitella teleta TaxID=283909 RepID=R7TKN6_CAPTE|nr:hypothetical protein CAPTEDRAFT_221287 [Capitella teleta]|eukprot:ELT94353.1 hypothetical protein CAPTEDRAFT_221287 [Capitella teleta]